jgi:hypothetical protein
MLSKLSYLLSGNTLTSSLPLFYIRALGALLEALSCKLAEGRCNFTNFAINKAS